jgi:CubicO group peptidase (beta-lactamase class C family)
MTPLLFALVLAGQSPALPRSTPEAQGIASSAILSFVDRADREIDALHSVMLLRHGHVVAEGWWAPYSAEAPHELYSLSKSFTSTAVGLAIDEGKLGLDDPVLKFFEAEAPDEPSANLKAMRVSDLLRMSTGHRTEPSLRASDDWAKTFLAHEVPFKPGTHFLYNTAATYMQSAIVQKATGQTVLDYLKPRLFEPLGIDDPTWGTSPQGVTLGGYGLSLRTEEIARFGQLLLQKGMWRGRQLVPAEWVEAATRLQTSNGSNPASDWDQGYGYQFWRCRNGAYRGDGAFGQYCVVMPEQDAVLVITSGVRNMQAVLDLAWETLLPAMKDEALPDDPTAAEALRARLAGLTLPTVEGAPSPPAAGRVAETTYAFPANGGQLEAIRIEPGSDERPTTLVVRSNGVEQRIACPTGAWAKGRAALGPFPERAVAATGAWTSDTTFTAKLCFYETPFITTLRLTLEDGRLVHEAETNVGFGPTRQPRLVGEAKE